MSYSPGPFPDAGQGSAAMANLAAGQPIARPRRRWVWYVVALVAMLAGIVVLVLGITSLTSLSSQANSAPRVSLPTSGSPVSLPHAGSYVIYYEAPGVTAQAAPRFDLQITPDSAGTSVSSLGPYGGSAAYSFGSRQGVAVGSLTVSSPGRYLVIAPSVPGATGSSDLAFGSAIAGTIVEGVTTAIAGIGLTMAGIAGLVITFVVGLVRRSQAGPPVPPATGRWQRS